MRGPLAPGLPRSVAGSTSSARPWASQHASRAIPRVGGPEVLDVVALPDPVPGDGQQLFDVSTAGVNYADTHHRL